MTPTPEEAAQLRAVAAARQLAEASNASAEAMRQLGIALQRAYAVPLPVFPPVFDQARPHARLTFGIWYEFGNGDMAQPTEGDKHE